MRRACAGPRGWLTGLTLLLGGCHLPEPGRPAAVFERLKPFTVPQAADVVGLQTALLEVPVGDHYLNNGFWAAADEQAIDLERKAVLEDNGFRVGLIGGIPPAEFQALITSERSNPDAHNLRLRADNARPLTIGEARPHCRFTLQTEGKPVPVSLENARCVLQVTPKLAADGAVQLTFLPVVQYGDKTILALPAEGGLRGQQATERYPALGWEVTLAGPTYVVVGTRFDRVDTLGHQFFVTTGAKPVQRLLAIRAARLTVPENAPEGSDAPGRPSLTPLAIHTVYTAVRGCGE